MSKFVSLWTFCALVLLSLPTFANAESASSHPVKNQIDKNAIIATWQPDEKALTSLFEAEQLLSSSRYLSASGNERQRVSQFLHKLRSEQPVLRGTQLERVVILEAKLMQGIHKFDDAMSHLNTIDVSRSAAAQLLLADISIQQGNGNKAKQHCEHLLGKTSFMLSFGCVLNADFAISPSIEVYHKLKKFEQYSSLPSSSSSPISSSFENSEFIWFKETLASMALSVGQPELAIKQLAEFEIASLPISAIIIWADAHYASGQYGTITSTLERDVTDQSRLDDALLLRWVKAQKALGEDNTKEMRLLGERMKIRAWREDTSHAAQVANYYLDIDPQPELALKFAQLNWQYAQTEHDKALLERAEKANSELSS
ncbi:hypothetical protein [Alteromonas hispanica]|uniref:Tetratricopeptide repeat protein n=1 Tax=Alteromonas hispanica TaxID=315421 RepID=A0A6L9MYA4_9ALTE|nr:hypothetical protein [Alteromonas hispanica]NDW22630.1 hypothetical protein [Alteromonas hispanica]